MNYKHGHYCKNKKYYCLICNKSITDSSKSGLCKSCSAKKRFTKEKPANYNKQIRICKQCNKKEMISLSKSHRPFCSIKCYRQWMLKNPEKTNRFNGGKPKCIECGTEVSYGLRGKRRCLKCYFKFSIGKNHPRYKDGTGREPYAFNFTPKLKKSIRKRDNYVCQFCGMTEEEHLNKYNRVLEIHHKDHNRKNSKRSNLITTCKKCNLER